MRTCRDCNTEKPASAFIAQRAQCNKCRSREQVAREKANRIAAGTHAECSNCKVVCLLSKFEALPNGGRSKSCITCRARLHRNRTVASVVKRFVPEGTGAPSREAALLALLHSLPGEPGVRLVPMVRCELPEAA